MGPFENPLVIHGNIGFNISGPPGGIIEPTYGHVPWALKHRLLSVCLSGFVTAMVYNAVLSVFVSVRLSVCLF